MAVIARPKGSTFEIDITGGGETANFVNICPEMFPEMTQDIETAEVKGICRDTYDIPTRIKKTMGTLEFMYDKDNEAHVYILGMYGKVQELSNQKFQATDLGLNSKITFTGNITSLTINGDDIPKVSIEVSIVGDVVKTPITNVRQARK